MSGMDVRHALQHLRSVLGFPSVTRMVCLANSRKYGGHCVAGKLLRTDGGSGWVRPVSARQTGELGEHERCYRGNREPQVLDIIDTPLLWPHPHTYQTENWRLDTHWRPHHVGRLRYDELAAIADDPPLLWLNRDSSKSGLHDRVDVSAAALLSSSLYLIHVREVGLQLFTTGTPQGELKRRMQAAFTHRDVSYHLWVTDPAFEARYVASPDGPFAMGDCYLTVSLGEPFEGYSYKLVAAVIDPQAAL